jgi:TRAP-type mannitol/chloroaromatic compound transport system substrate-binding protein
MKLLTKAITLASAITLLSSCGGDDNKSNTVAKIQNNDKTYNLSLAMTWPSSLPIFTDSVKNMAKYANQMSNGRINIRIDDKGKHKAALGIFDLVKSGQYDLGHTASYYYKGKVPETLYFTTMPFGMTTAEQWAWFEHGGGNELMDEVYAKHNLISVNGGNTGNQMGGWFQKEINSVADLKGLKMRIPGFAGEVLAELGAKPTNIPAGELYTALDRKTIDALEWVGPSLDLRMGFHKIAPYYYTGWHEPATELNFLINREKFNAMPADLQAVLKNAMKLAAYEMYVHSTHESAKNWQSMKAEYPNIKVKTFPKEVIAAMKNANASLLEKKSSEGAIAAKIIKSQQDYMQKVRAWSEISDQAYLNSLK